MAGPTFLGPNAPAMTNPLPWALNTTGPSAFSSYSLKDINYDWAVAGIPFLAGESLRETFFRRQYLREFAEIRKDQFDSLPSPGEQSFQGHWLEAQTDFHGGAGTRYFDTLRDQSLEFRYDYSEHIDVMSDVAQFSLTQATKLLYTPTTGVTGLRGILTGANYVLVADGAKVQRVAYDGTVLTLNTGGLITHNIVSLTDDGANWYAANDQGIFKGAIQSAGVETKAWNCTSNVVVIDFIKGRLIAAILNSVFELVGGTPPTLPAAKFTHTNSDWHATSMTNTPTAILVAGNSGGQSDILKFTLDTGGALPVLTSGTMAASFPFGEVVNKIYGYVGNFVGIVTSKGCRIATVDNNAGNLTYGPLVIKDPSGMNAITGTDRYLFVSNNNGFQTSTGAVDTSRCGLWRLDTGMPTVNNAYAYMSDLDSHTAGTVLYACQFGLTVASADLIVFALDGTKGVFITDQNNKESSGYLRTSKIRYSTMEPKHFKFIYPKAADLTDGSIQVSLVSPTQPVPGLVIQYSAATGSVSSANMSAPLFVRDGGNQVEWVQLILTLGRGTSNTNVSPFMYGYQIRALPGVNRELLFTLPFLATDYERDNQGNIVGHPGFAYERVTALEAGLKAGNIVAVQDLQHNVSYSGFVEAYRFEQQAVPQKTDSFGGYVLLQMRIVL